MRAPWAIEHALAGPRRSDRTLPVQPASTRLTKPCSPNGLTIKSATMITPSQN